MVNVTEERQKTANLQSDPSHPTGNAFHAFGALENQGLQKANRYTYTPAQSRRQELARKRVIKGAINHFNSEMPGRFKGRTWALDRIRTHKAPLTEAKRLIKWFRTQDIVVVTDEGVLDFSDVQELRVKLIKRDYILDQPQAHLLNRMDQMIATGIADRATFEDMASAALGMKPALPRDIRTRKFG